MLWSKLESNLMGRAAQRTQEVGEALEEGGVEGVKKLDAKKNQGLVKHDSLFQNITLDNKKDEAKKKRSREEEKEQTLNSNGKKIPRVPVRT